MINTYLVNEYRLSVFVKVHEERYQYIFLSVETMHQLRVIFAIHYRGFINHHNPFEVCTSGPSITFRWTQHTLQVIIVGQ